MWTFVVGQMQVKYIASRFKTTTIINNCETNIIIVIIIIIIIGSATVATTEKTRPHDHITQNRNDTQPTRIYNCIQNITQVAPPQHLSSAYYIYKLTSPCTY